MENGRCSCIRTAYSSGLCAHNEDNFMTGSLYSSNDMASVVFAIGMIRYLFRTLTCNL